MKMDAFFLTRANHTMDLVDRLNKIIIRNASGDRLENRIPLEAILQEHSNSSIHLNLGDLSPRSSAEIIVLSAAYSILFIISLFGNTLSCFVIYQDKKLHTVTNLFLVNLATSDLLITLINIPFNILRNVRNEWVVGPVMCPFINFVLIVSIYVSTYTMAAIAIDRYIVLLYPLRPRITIRVGLVIIVVTWLGSMLMSLPFAIYTRALPVELFLQTVIRCRVLYPEPSDRYERYVTILTFVGQYIIPLIIVVFSYGQIIRRLWMRHLIGLPTKFQQYHHNLSKRRSVKMLICVVLVFCLCWLPLNLYHILTDFHPNTKVFHYNSTAYLTCHFIAMSSVCYNPFIYCWLNESFRRTLRNRLKCSSRKPPKQPQVDAAECRMLMTDRIIRVGQRTKTGSSHPNNRINYHRSSSSSKVEIPLYVEVHNLESLSSSSHSHQQYHSRRNSATFDK